MCTSARLSPYCSDHKRTDSLTVSKDNKEQVELGLLRGADLLAGETDTTIVDSVEGDNLDYPVIFFGRVLDGLSSRRDIIEQVLSLNRDLHGIMTEKSIVSRRGNGRHTLTREILHLATLLLLLRFSLLPVSSLLIKIARKRHQP